MMALNNTIKAEKVMIMVGRYSTGINLAATSVATLMTVKIITPMKDGFSRW